MQIRGPPVGSDPRVGDPWTQEEVSPMRVKPSPSSEEQEEEGPLLSGGVLSTDAFSFLEGASVSLLE